MKTQTAILLSRPYQAQDGSWKAAARINGRHESILVTAEHAQWRASRKLEVVMGSDGWRAA